jgi:methylenetetrahydrofolate reductase (NADPH)
MSQDNEEALKLYGISLWTVLCQRLLDAGVPGVHIYTLNNDKLAIAILRSCGLLPAVAVAAVDATPPLASNGTH